VVRRNLQRRVYHGGHDGSRRISFFRYDFKWLLMQYLGDFLGGRKVRKTRRTGRTSRTCLTGETGDVRGKDVFFCKMKKNVKKLEFFVTLLKFECLM
jgi:hypothetical protein